MINEILQYRRQVNTSLPVCLFDSETYAQTQRGLRHGIAPQSFSSSFDSNTGWGEVVNFLVTEVYGNPNSDVAIAFAHSYLRPIRDLNELNERQKVVKEAVENEKVLSSLESVVNSPHIQTWDDHYFRDYKGNFYHSCESAIEFLEAANAIKGDHPRLRNMRNFAQNVIDRKAYKEIKMLVKSLSPFYEEKFDSLIVSGMQWSGKTLVNRFLSISGDYTDKEPNEETTRAIRNFEWHGIELKRSLYKALLLLNETYGRVFKDKGLSKIIDCHEAETFQLRQELVYGLKRIGTSSWIDEDLVIQYKPENDKFFMERLPQIIGHIYQLVDEALEKRMRKLPVDSNHLKSEAALYVALAKSALSWNDKGYPITLPKLLNPEQRTFNVSEAYVPSLACKGVEVIPNDIISSPNERIFSIEGPNQDGKTTYLRLISQFSPLVQLGGYVIAKSAKASIVDGVFTSFGKKDKTKDNEGTYLAQLNFAKTVLAPDSLKMLFDGDKRSEFVEWYNGGNHAFVTPHSLLLLDEIAIGTDTQETLRRAGLILEDADDRGSTVYLSTHCHEIGDLIESKRFSCALNLATIVEQQSDGALMYLRKIVRGKREGSYGEFLAKQAGVTEENLRIARDIIKTIFQKE